MELMAYRPWEGRLAQDPWGSVLEWPIRALSQIVDRPSVEVTEKDHFVIVRAEVPGVEPEDLEVRVGRDAITLRGEVRSREEGGERERGFYHSERRYGSFARSIALPTTVRPDAAKAVLRHGVLEIQVATDREEDRETRRIEVETAH